MKKIIAIIVIVIILAIIGIYFYIQKSSVDNTVPNTTASVSNVVGKSNPFEVKVDPYQGYKNPFGEN